jgi:radical SAM protein
MKEADPRELSFDEGKALLESVKALGPPTPMLILTGGDLLMRPDLDQLIGYARDLGIRVAVSPSVTPLLTKDRLKWFVDMGIKGISISLDGASAAVHDGIRGVPGTFDETLKRLKEAADLGMRVQINSAVMRSTVNDLPDIVRLMKDLGVKIWEVFFLIRTGRGAEMEDLEPWEYEEVCHWLYDASCYGILVRTTEAPFFRRVMIQRQEGRDDIPEMKGTLLSPLRQRLVEVMGPPDPVSASKVVATGDGRGIVFVSHRGDVFPSGYLSYPVANVRDKNLVDIYRDEKLFRDLRSQDRPLGGRCGVCTYKDICGGSRARAYATYQDPLAEDPACIYQPAS